MEGGGTYNRSIILLESFVTLPCIALQALPGSDRTDSVMHTLPALAAGMTTGR
jgi:hypothetical protein